MNCISRCFPCLFPNYQDQPLLHYEEDGVDAYITPPSTAPSSPIAIPGAPITRPEAMMHSPVGSFPGRGHSPSFHDVTEYHSQ